MVRVKGGRQPAYIRKARTGERLEQRMSGVGAQSDLAEGEKERRVALVFLHVVRLQGRRCCRWGETGALLKGLRDAE